MSSFLKTLLISTGIISCLGFAACTKQKQESTTVSLPEQIPVKQRHTFDESVPQLIDRYNLVMSEIDRSLLLPPQAAMQPGGKGDQWHALTHQVAPQIYVALEIDNQSGRPFSLGFYAKAPGSSGAKGALKLISVIAAISAGLLGKDSEGTKAFAHACKEAPNTKSRTIQKNYEGLLLTCSNDSGDWIGSISVPDI